MNMFVRIGIGAVVGALIGLAIHKFVGCRDGACPLTGNPIISMTIYALMGAIIGYGK